ncbi:ABC transporter substrate-binding protein, partial [Escherichia coli]|nr:ABC transporter substrate-binding protein [Escherichia coli]
TAQVNAFKNSEIDALTFSSNNILQTVKGRKDIQIRLGYSSQVNVLNFNGKAGFLKDQAVRKALAQAFDRDIFEKVHFQGLNCTPDDPG